MSEDVYFNCPNCSHTVVAELDLVGKTVQCPDCEEDVLVPLIREGLNPRFKTSTAAGGGAKGGKQNVGDILEGAEKAKKGMVSLERRQKVHGRNLDHMTQTLGLFTDQIQMIEQFVLEATSEKPVEEETQPNVEKVLNLPPEEGETLESERLSLIFSILTVVVGLGAMIWLLWPLGS
jgi:DNA-directed RNA polymerase subunit RPC12/RpoP